MIVCQYRSSSPQISRKTLQILESRCCSGQLGQSQLPKAKNKDLNASIFAELRKAMKRSETLTPSSGLNCLSLYELQYR